MEAPSSPYTINMFGKICGMLVRPLPAYEGLPVRETSCGAVLFKVPAWCVFERARVLIDLCQSLYDKNMICWGHVECGWLFTAP